MRSDLASRAEQHPEVGAAGQHHGLHVHVRPREYGSRAPGITFFKAEQRSSDAAASCHGCLMQQLFSYHGTCGSTIFYTMIYEFTEPYLLT